MGGGCLWVTEAPGVCVAASGRWARRCRWHEAGPWEMMGAYVAGQSRRMHDQCRLLVHHRDDDAVMRLHARISMLWVVRCCG